MKSSRLKGFYKLGRGQRLDHLREFSALPVDQTRLLGQDASLPFEIADLFIENAIGSYPLPLGVATGFKINDKDFIVPFAVEESSVIAAASNAAKWIYECGGFKASTLSSLMIGQIQILDVHPEQMPALEQKILGRRNDFLKMANEIHPRLLMRGGGAKDIEVRSFPHAEIPFMVLHVLLDTRDAMGANLVNTVCEKLAPFVEKLCEARVGLKILSNFADRRVYRAEFRLRPELLELKEARSTDKFLAGPEIGRRIVEAFVFADNDPYRAATHNKGIMNGVDPVVIATGNDWRAVEAGAHAFAARTGRYRSLSKWKMDAATGELCGELEIPLQLGTVGGVTRLHPLARISLQILQNPNADTLGQIIACAGLASNLAALRALTTLGIQRGHMKLHAKNLALAAGSRWDEVEAVSQRLMQDTNVTASAAEEILALLRTEKKAAQQQSLEMENNAL